MIVSYKVAKYLQSIGYHNDCKKEYWGGVLHNFSDSYRPLENTYAAPDIIEALDWISEKTLYNITIEKYDGKYHAIVGEDGSTVVQCLEFFNKPSESINSALEYIALKALES